MISTNESLMRIHYDSYLIGLEPFGGEQLTVIVDPKTREAMRTTEETVLAWAKSKGLPTPGRNWSVP